MTNPNTTRSARVAGHAALRWILMSAVWTGCASAPPATDPGPSEPDLVSSPEEEPLADAEDTDVEVPVRSDMNGACPSFPAPEPTAGTLSTSPFEAEVVSTRKDSLACLIVRDLDRDGYTDVLYGSADPLDGDRGELHLRWGGAGRAAQTVVWSTPSLPHACLAEDLDGDPDLELMVFDPDGIVVVDGLAARAPQIRPMYEAEPGLFTVGVMSVAEVDLDLDADQDMIVTVSGINPNCGFAQPDEEDTGDVIVTADGQTMGTVMCLERKADGTLARMDHEPCPAALRAHSTVYPFQISLQDLGNDGHPEILATGDFSANTYLTSTPSGWVPANDAGFHEYNHAMGVAWFDYDHDGLRDAFVTDLGPNQLHRNQDCSLFFDEAWIRGVAPATHGVVTWGPVLADFDLNGSDDLFVPNSIEPDEGHQGSECEQFGVGIFPRPNDFLFSYDNEGNFTRVDVPSPSTDVASVWVPVHAAGGDLDQDGDVDVVVTDRARGTVIFWNNATRAGRWLAIAPVDDRGLPVEPTRIVVEQGQHTRVRELWRTTGTTGQEEGIARFGLGDETGPVDVRVRWPDGSWTYHTGLDVDALHRLRRPDM